jgi:hypothetical protein
MMDNYPSAWVPTANGIAMQRARIILPLAFLVRANDTALHRQWLTTAIDGLLTRQHCEGTWCAYKEELSHPGWGGSTAAPTSNAAYGTGEAPLNQENDDPVTDFLYTSNFALLGLHEVRCGLFDRNLHSMIPFGSHAWSLEVNMRVTNGIPLGCLLLLPVDTVNCVQTLKAAAATQGMQP